MIMKKIDIEEQIIGFNLARLRKAAGLSQAQLGAKLKRSVSFQQIQKYERGVNRVSASALWRFSEALNVDIKEFYRGWDAPKLTALCNSQQAQRDKAARLLAKITDPKAISIAIDQIAVISNHYQIK